MKLSCVAVDQGCICSAFTEGEGEGDVGCSPANFPGTLCCADQDWPSSPPTTSCHCLTNEDGSTPSSCEEVSFAGDILPGVVSACDLDHSPAGG